LPTLISKSFADSTARRVRALLGVLDTGAILPALLTAVALLWGVPLAADDTAAATDLSFADFFADDSASSLTPAARQLSLNGQRVRLVGFMAEVETPSPGSFYLCPHPVRLGEEGAGTGDLPPDAVRVGMPAWEGRVVPFIRHRVQVTGILDVGYREGARGEASWIRLTADGPATPTEK
jgi:hypothetical protein